MDNHPIPQDVTGFQFRLIGNMTVRQFCFLAAGCVLALLVYYMPIFILFKVLFIPLFAGTGFALAFMPVEGRPLDAMIGYFIKALLSPNQYVFHKAPVHFSFDTLPSSTPSLPVHIPVAVQKKTSTTGDSQTKQKQLQEYLQKLDHNASPTDKKESTFLSSVMASSSSQPAPAVDTSIPAPQPILMPALQTPPQIAVPPPVEVSLPPMKEPHEFNTGASLGGIVPIATVDDTSDRLAHKAEVQELAKKEEELKKKEEEAQKRKEEEEMRLKEKEEESKKLEEHAQGVAEENKMTHAKLLELEKSYQEMLAQKQSLEQELHSLKTQASKPEATQSFAPTQAKQEEPKQATKLVQQVPQDQAVKKGLPPTPDVPNILLGVVKDSSGNILPNVLIEVKDSDSNPVRAFKTNQLGQFASATPLMKGTYTIEFEDTSGKNKFDAIEITANDEILLPIEVLSHDLREELRKELFN